MTSTDVPVNRAMVGVLALVCVGLGAILWLLTGDDTANMWPGAFIRVGAVMGALWLALPTRDREAAWARVSIWNVLGTLLALIVIVRARLPFKLLIPAAVVFAVAILVLRPRQKERPGRR